MDFVYHRNYRGKLKAVILDWAGTTMDYGCYAPAVVFVEVYKRKGVPISMEEARVPMGAHKKVHIRKISQLDSVSKRWEEIHGRKPNEDDVDEMFADFEASDRLEFTAAATTSLFSRLFRFDSWYA